MQGSRRATGPAPLREGGGAAMNERRMHGKRPAARAATGGVLRSAVVTITTFHCQQKKQSLCGWSMRKPASTATRSTPPAALSFRSTLAIHKPSSSGRPPLSKGGECLRALHALNTAPIAQTPSSQSTKIPEEPGFPSPGNPRAGRPRPQHPHAFPSVFHPPPGWGGAPWKRFSGCLFPSLAPSVRARLKAAPPKKGRGWS